jgi:hypothetical protein
MGYLTGRGLKRYPAERQAGDERIPRRSFDPLLSPDIAQFRKPQRIRAARRSGDVFDINASDAFVWLNQSSITLAVALQDVLAIPSSNPVVRTYLAVRYASGSAGVLLIAFDQPPTLATAAFELTPGTQFAWDIRVPQNDIHIACTVLPGTAVVTAASGKGAR